MKKKTFTPGDGRKHTVKKDGKRVVVQHSDGKKIDLTKKAGAKTVAQGVKASKAYHAKDRKKK